MATKQDEHRVTGRVMGLMRQSASRRDIAEAELARAEVRLSRATDKVAELNMQVKQLEAEIAELDVAGESEEVAA